jgi:S1-C subfamily serine protease
MKMLAGLAVLLVAGVCYAGDSVTTARDLVAKYQNAVITVKLAIKQSMSAPGRESPKVETKTETTGTVIDPTGLTVVSLSSTDPSDAYQKVMERAMASQGRSASQMKIESEITDMKLLFSDGTEVPAEVVLRDKDLDLAFVRPTDPVAKPVAYVDLSHSTQPQLLDEAIVLNRLNPTANRTIAVSLGRIEAFVNKPRPFYILGEATWGYSLGAPVFAVDGKILGILLLRISTAQIDATSGFMNQHLNQWGIMPIILPAADIADGAKQAKEAKVTPPENKLAPAEKSAPATSPTKE